MALKLGRTPARFTLRSVRRMTIMLRALDALGTPPAVSNDYVAAVDKVTGGDWGMAGNDTYGDCTCADCSHQLMLRTANTGTIIIPTTQQTETLYAILQGYTGDTTNYSAIQTYLASNDNGCDELTVIQYLESTGLLGHKVEAAANIDITNHDHIMWAVQLYGASRIGFQVPQSAMDQFNAGQPWDVVANDGGIQGGHDVPIVKYDANYLYVVTWAKLQPMTWAFFDKYTEEAHAELSSDDWFSATGSAPSGYDNATLLADLQAVT